MTLGVVRASPQAVASERRACVDGGLLCRCLARLDWVQVTELREAYQNAVKQAQ